MTEGILNDWGKQLCFLYQWRRCAKNIDCEDLILLSEALFWIHIVSRFSKQNSKKGTTIVQHRAWAGNSSCTAATKQRGGASWLQQRGGAGWLQQRGGAGWLQLCNKGEGLVCCNKKEGLEVEEVTAASCGHCPYVRVWPRQEVGNGLESRTLFLESLWNI